MWIATNEGWVKGRQEGEVEPQALEQMEVGIMLVSTGVQLLGIGGPYLLGLKDVHKFIILLPLSQVGPLSNTPSIGPPAIF